MRLVYLVINNERTEVNLEFKKPARVRVSEHQTTWYFQNFTFRVGECDERLFYNRTWTGPIGVFDLDMPGHLQKLFKGSQAHLKLLLGKQIKLAVVEHVPLEALSPHLPQQGGTVKTPVGAAIHQVFFDGDRTVDF